MTRICKGAYRGDVSAVCFLRLSSSVSILLVGTGPQLLIYDLSSGNLLLTCSVFDGVRVHGIHTSSECTRVESPDSFTEITTVVVHGERKVKVLEIQWHRDSLGKEYPQVELLQSLPRFSSWVLDVRFLQASSNQSEEGEKLVAVGLSNNSMWLWSMLSLQFVYRVECSEMCLLFSMRLWGSRLDLLQVAAGTVFNEVLVWKVRSEILLASLAPRQTLGFPSNKEAGKVGEGDSMMPRLFGNDLVKPLQRLVGHEGCIQRISWSSDGLSLITVSDDRSARVWKTRECKLTDNSGAWCGGIEAGPVLYGHTSRLWDCFIAADLLITASEDCTCRIWSSRGVCLATLRGHRGRGIWRCVYDQEMDILVTAGSDSSIKVHSSIRTSSLSASCLSNQADDLQNTSIQLENKQEVFCLSPCWLDTSGTRLASFMDSKSEYIRCVALASPWSLYVCTNRGFLYHITLLRDKEETWTILAEDSSCPLVCMDVLVQESITLESKCGRCQGLEKHMVSVGDGDGQVTILEVQIIDSLPRCIWRHTWPVEKQRKLMGVFWCRTLGPSFILTTNHIGGWQLWFLGLRCDGSGMHMEVPASTGSGVSNSKRNEKQVSQLIAQCRSSSARIVCVDVCPDQELLVCGDKQGNLLAFLFPTSLSNCWNELPLARKEPQTPAELPVLSVFKGAHGISAVASVQIKSTRHKEQAVIHSTGRDGCLCRFSLNKSCDFAQENSAVFVCLEIEKVSAISVVESVVYQPKSGLQNESQMTVAAGFTGSNFLVWDLTRQCEVMRVSCGGWRRPHSYLVGHTPESQQCFVFVKDQAIHVHRHWVIDMGNVPPAVRPIAIKSLQEQFHGKEILSVQFIHTPSSPLVNNLSWIATGGEDGAVLISRYNIDAQGQVESTRALKEHVGGSSVKSLDLVTEFHLVNCPEILCTNMCSKGSEPAFHLESSGSTTLQQFLFSVGAKEIITCWLLEWEPHSIVQIETPLHTAGYYSVDQFCASEEIKECFVKKGWRLICKWVSTNMPQRGIEQVTYVKNREKAIFQGHVETNAFPTDKPDINKASQAIGVDFHTDGEWPMVIGSRDDNDQRYLAVTIFGTKSAKTGKSFFFLVTAGSSAVLCLHGFHFESRQWSKIALLEYHDAPVLTLQHIVGSFSASGLSDVFLILSGATNGAVAIWDITETVHAFFSNNSSMGQVEQTQLRPLTGRGSQGGSRWRKSRMHSTVCEAAKGNSIKTLHASSIFEDTMEENKTGNSSVEQLLPTPSGSDSMNIDSVSSSGQINEEAKVISDSAINPVHVVVAHQSGVNCLSFAEVKRERLSSSNMASIVYAVITGGDDQALHLMTFSLQHRFSGNHSQQQAAATTPEGPWNCDRVAESTRRPVTFQILNQRLFPCSHNSALKGVWTNGTWVFSTGLDQRLRFWHLNVSFLDDYSSSSNNVEDGDVENQHGASPLLECTHCVMDVPEAASLDVEQDNQGKYRIAVGGRGLQVVSFDSNIECKHAYKKDSNLECKYV